MEKNKKNIIRPLLFTVGVLLIPFFGNVYVDGWNWPWTAFLFFGTILFGAGLVYELKGRHAKKGITIGFIFGELVAASMLATLKYLNPTDDITGIVIMSLLICGLFFAWLGYLMQTMPMIKKIKIIHSLIWLIMVAAIFYILYAGITNKLDNYLWLAIGLMVFEGLTLLINKGNCPLTIVAKRNKSDYQNGDDIFLPQWLAIHNKLIFGSILILGILILLYRLI